MSYSLITGATGGIGSAFAINLAKEGKDLFLTGRNTDKLLLLKDSLVKEYNINVQIFSCDITSDSDISKMFSFIDESGIELETLVNVAGVDIQKPFTEYTREKVLFQTRVNVEGTILVTYEFLKRKSKRAKIITISSMSGVSPMPYFAIYSASKSMLTSFFTSLSYELKRDGVTVTIVLPGGVPTRPDLVKEIKTQGLWGKLSSKSADYVARKSISASNKNKRLFIPGFFNRLLYFFMKIVPKKLTLLFIAKRWKTHRKDAF